MTMTGPTALRAVRRSLAYSIQGVRVVVTGDDAWVLDRVDDTYGPLRVPIAGGDQGNGPLVAIGFAADGPADDTFTIEVGGRTAQVAGRHDALLVVLDAIAAGLVDGLDVLGLIGIHAGAVEVDGRAIAISGRSKAGKTTLVLELVRRGARLLSDEMAVIARDGRTVLPYARGLHIRPDTADLIPELAFLRQRPRHEIGGGSEWSLAPDELARVVGTALGSPAPLAGILLLGRAPDPSRAPEIATLPAAIAAVELAAATPVAALDYAAALGRLSTIAGSVRCARLASGELRTTGQAVLDWLGTLP